MDMTPLWISLQVAVPAAAITFIAGLVAAWAVSYCGKAKHVADSIFTIPLVLPPTVVGFLLLIVFGTNSTIGGALLKVGIRLIFTKTGAVIAASVVSFPVMYRGARGALDQVDRNLVYAARSLGMNEFTILLRILIPCAWPGIAASAILSFARALGEFGATIMVAGNIPGKTQTMSIAVYTAMQSGNREKAYTWVIITVLFSLMILIAMNILTDRGARRLRRGT
ncbi:MAG: molybdate ABC transporter permease subunit [Clostridiales bacterium]|nr:molybdate ABC transporter permease subunit [Clostridiales bacterium]